MLDPHKVFYPVQMQRTSHVIEEQIKQAIFENHYQTGDKLPSERELAQIFGNRGSVREAFHSLEKSGFIIIKKGARGGAYVSAINSRFAVDSLKDMLRMGQVSLEEILHARLLLEPPIAAEAALKATQRDIERLEKAEQIVEHGHKSGEPAIANNPILHLEIAEITGNKVLSLMMNVLMGIHAFRMRNIKVDAKGKKLVRDQHDSIVAAIKKRNAKMAYENMKRHIVQAHRDLLKAERKASSTSHETMRTKPTVSTRKAEKGQISLMYVTTGQGLTHPAVESGPT